MVRSYDLWRSWERREEHWGTGETSCLSFLARCSIGFVHRMYLCQFLALSPCLSLICFFSSLLFSLCVRVYVCAAVFPCDSLTRVHADVINQASRSLVVVFIRRRRPCCCCCCCFGLIILLLFQHIYQLGTPRINCDFPRFAYIRLQYLSIAFFVFLLPIPAACARLVGSSLYNAR
jgi:hypothetical protein